MDGARFDELARTLAGTVPRRAVLFGLASAAAGLLGRQTVEAACPAGQVERRGTGCVCKRTGRPPVNGSCCDGNQRDCGGTCVPLTGCCTAADCPAGPEHSVTICRQGVCRTACDSGNGATVCGEGCCPDGTSCADESQGTCCASGLACDGECCPTATDICHFGLCCTPSDPDVACAAVPGVRSKLCGVLGMDCSVAVDCGGCQLPETCGGGGQGHVCGCTPKTCAQQRIFCGTAADGCGGTLDCGGCPSGQTCGAEFPNYCSGGCTCSGDEICGLTNVAPVGSSPNLRPGCCLPPGAAIPGGCTSATVGRCCLFLGQPGGVLSSCDDDDDICWFN